MSGREASPREPEAPGVRWLRWESSGHRAGNREAAEALLAELLGDPAEKWTRTLRRRRFRDPALVELLLEKSREAQPGDPEMADMLAMMASILAVQLHDAEEGSALVAVFLGRAHCLSGNARRLMGNEAEAEVAFNNTVAFLGRSAGSCDRAFYCRSLALLRWEQGRIDEAAALLHHAARIFAENQALHEEGTTQALLGLLYCEEGAADRAVPLLCQARRAAKSGDRPWLVVRARLALALGVAQSGQLDRARWLLREAWEVYPQVHDPEELVRVHWLEGRVSSLVGPQADAAVLIDSARLKFVGEGRLPEAALASLDLALHLAECGQERAVAALAQDFERRLGAEDGAEAGLRVLQRFERSAAEGKGLRDTAAGLASFLRRTYRSRGFRVEPLPFA